MIFRSKDANPEVAALAEELHLILTLQPMKREEIFRAALEAMKAFADLPTSEVKPAAPPSGKR